MYILRNKITGKFFKGWKKYSLDRPVPLTGAACVLERWPGEDLKWLGEEWEVWTNVGRRN